MRSNKTKMTFTVTGASKFLQHSVMQFLAAEGVSPIEIYRHMKKVYVDNCMSRARVPDLSPCAFQIFSKLRSDLEGRRFATLGDVIEVLQQ
ncbi:hypothetical protein ANN_26760 [Periplaneta americana]|uniref:Uncharacterized protein n=1 Tax=Periplaneta americana TaxID=6978 RepID=A0ABQ8RZ48_PERAM|nr:hypothetical protein ANN_26760 [Periplaneta americana]